MAFQENVPFLTVSKLQSNIILVKNYMKVRREKRTKKPNGTINFV